MAEEEEKEEEEEEGKGEGFAEGWRLEGGVEEANGGCLGLQLCLRTLRFERSTGALRVGPAGGLSC
jgi:hypothetical protein